MMNRDAAERIISVASACSRKLDESVALVKDTCADEERKLYARRVGPAMAGIFEFILSPLYDEHPDLAPEWYRSKWGRQP